MKQLFFILATLFISNLVLAQKNFEGIVTYRLHSNEGEKKDAELKVLFGVKKLKVFFKEHDEYEKEALVINLDSATVYNVNFEAKTFKRNTLILTAPEQKPEKKRINGFATTPFKPETTGLGSLLGGMLGTSSVIFYLADSLYYYIPAAFAGNKELLMVQQNKIVLGADIQIVNPFGEFVDSSAKKANIITAEAFNIKPMAIDESEFLIPVDFTDRKDIVYPDDGTTDTTVVAVDTFAVASPVPSIKTVKKKPVKPVAPKAKPATKAIRRKE